MNITSPRIFLTANFTASSSIRLRPGRSPGFPPSAPPASQTSLHFHSSIVFASSLRCWRLLRDCDAPKQPSSADGEAKDTLRNIRETKEFVINIVTYELAEAMNVTSGEYDASVNEFELAGIKTAPSEIVKVPRVAASPVSFECKLYQILDFSPSPQKQQPGDR